MKTKYTFFLFRIRFVLTENTVLERICMLAKKQQHPFRFTYMTNSQVTKPSLQTIAVSVLLVFYYAEIVYEKEPVNSLNASKTNSILKNELDLYAS